MPQSENLRDKYHFVLEMEVRDYELDSEKIVNNANYLHYMEHTRHKFCEAAGVPFIELVKEGLIVVVRKIEIEYFTSLKSGDNFYSCLNMSRKGPRFIFHQDIYLPDGGIVVKAVITVAALKEGKLTRGDDLAEKFAKYLK